MKSENLKVQSSKSKGQRAKCKMKKAKDNLHFPFWNLPFALCLLLFTFCFLLSSCNINRFLKNDEYVLRSNKFEIKGDISRKESANIKKVLLPPLSRQKELPTIIFFKTKIGVWSYFQANLKEGKGGLMPSIYRTLSSKPVIFDEKLTQISANNMHQALINAGYRENSITFDKLFTGKDKGLADITYNVKLGPLYVIDSLNYVCADTMYQNLLKQSQNQSFLNRGAALSVSNYEKEKSRIVDFFNSIGYARFVPNFISPLDADTIIKFNDKNQRLVDASLTVVLPADSSQLRKFYIGDVTVFPNFDINKGETIKYDTVIGTNVIRTYDGDIGLKGNLLNDLITFKSGEVFNKSTIAKTDKKFRNIGVYKFVNIVPKIDECDSNAVALNLYLTKNKKMYFESGADLNFSILKDSSNNNLYRVGGSVNFGFTHRNLFNSAIRLSSVISAGADLGANTPQGSNNGTSYDLRFDNRFNFPKILNLNPTWGLINKLGFISEKFKEEYKDNAITEVNATFSTTNRLELDLFRLDRYNIGLRDILKRENNISERFVISPAALELNLGKITDSFAIRNANQTRIIRSFDTTLVTGLLFRSFNYDFITKLNQQNQIFQFAFGFQQSGAETWLYDQIFRAGKEPSRLNGISLSKFVRFDADFRYTKEILPNIKYALRTSLGVEAPYADSQAVPFSYQYLLGGTNSIRAWRLGSIGPGGFYDANISNSSFPAQAGEFKFEINSEIRFPIYSYLKGAIFLDAGNVWNLTKDEASPKAEISKYWYTQMAIGTGIGFRLDVDYFLIRLDIGYKLRYPYPAFPDNGYWIPINTWIANDQVNWNFGIGLPF